MLQANSLVQCLKERFPDQKPWNVELFGGSPGRQQRLLLLRRRHVGPAADDRRRATSSIPSGQMGMDVVGTLRWDGAVAQSRMDNLLSANYGDKHAARRAVAL